MGGCCRTVGSALIAGGMALLLSSCTPGPGGDPAKAKSAGDGAPDAIGIARQEVRTVRADNVLKMRLVWCPPGSFTMGPLPVDRVRGDPPSVQVTISAGYWMGECEVTQAQWQLVMGSTPWKGKKYVKEGADYPATYVSSDDALEFCEALTETERRAGRLETGWEYTLPTEAQWEYACQAGARTRYFFGDDKSLLDQYAWIAKNSLEAGEYYPSPHRVRLKKPNPWGLYDIYGNVDEWCVDVYASQPPGGKDPKVTGKDSIRVGFWDTSRRMIRGGDCNSVSSACRADIRTFSSRNARASYHGFRVVLSATGD
jgi:formylglycine-generating enzyme required for sulfatase activity